MSGGSSWRSPSTADQYRHHDYVDFAQEYLQRNADYRRDHTETMARIAAAPDVEPLEREGSGRAVGPLLSPPRPIQDPRTAPALWSPAEAPDVVVLATADIEAAVSLPSDCESLAEAISNSEHHMVIALGIARLRLCLRPVPFMCPECLIILHDQSTPSALPLRPALIGRHTATVLCRIGYPCLPLTNVRAISSSCESTMRWRLVPPRATSPLALSFGDIARLLGRYGKDRAKGGTCSG